jgi:hypothetical protein
MALMTNSKPKKRREEKVMRDETMDQFILLLGMR